MAAAALARRIMSRGTSRKIQVPGSSLSSWVAFALGMIGSVPLAPNRFNYGLTYKAIFTYHRSLLKGGENDVDVQSVDSFASPIEGQIGCYL